MSSKHESKNWMIRIYAIRVISALVVAWCGWSLMAFFISAFPMTTGPPLSVISQPKRNRSWEAGGTFSLEGSWVFADFPFNLSLTPVARAIPVPSAQFLEECALESSGVRLSNRQAINLEKIFEAVGKAKLSKGGLSCNEFRDSGLQILVVTKGTQKEKWLIGVSLDKINTSSGAWAHYRLTPAAPAEVSGSLFPEHFEVETLVTRLNMRPEPVLQLGIVDSKQSHLLFRDGTSNTATYKVVAKLGLDRVVVCAFAVRR